MLFQKISSSIPEDIEYICRLLFESFKMPVYFLDSTNELFFSFTYGHLSNPLSPDMSKVFIDLFRGTDSYKHPVIKSTKLLENYFAVNLCVEESFLGKFIVGPSVYSQINSAAVDALIFTNNILLSYKRELINYYKALSVMDYSRLVSSSQLLNLVIYNQRIDLNTVIEKNSSLQNVHLKLKNSYEHNISENRQNTFFHHSLSSEKLALQCIKAGDTMGLIKALQVPMDGEQGVLSKNNALRNQKNLSICFITLATRAAIDGGLDLELSLTLSDSAIQAIEELDDIRDLTDLTMKIVCDFSNRVNKVKMLKYSSTTLQCQSYVQKHLYENISISNIAEILQLTPNYLSELFKKEVGIPISEYIQRKRVEEAKRLLVSTRHSILDISTRLNFHDQSHFTKVFKKFTGTSPKRYRDTNN